MIAPARALLVAMFAMCASAAGAHERPVVLELFTSQGCSSCPPADAFLVELAEREGIIALALHVDIWDYLGWQDSFARSAFTKRQHAYAAAFGERMIFTPQMIVDGRAHFVGSNRAEIEAAIAEARERPFPVTVTIEAGADGLSVHVGEAPGTPPATVSYVIHAAPQEVSITSGENGGATHLYANPVTKWLRLGGWTGEAMTWPLPLSEEEGGIAVLVQDAETMEVLGAAALSLPLP